MENQNSGRRHREQSSSTSSPSSRRSLKRKLEEESVEEGARIDDQSSMDLHQDLVRKVRAQVEILDSALSSAEKDRASVKHAISVLSDLARSGNVKIEKGSRWKLFSFLYFLVNSLFN